VPEIIENEKTGLLINPAKPKEIADAIEKLIKDAKLRKTLAQNLHQKILQEFSFEKMLQQTLAAYEN
jgi:glycosyltransferase involved in cell wall biosynthesis